MRIAASNTVLHLGLISPSAGVSGVTGRTGTLRMAPPDPAPSHLRLGEGAEDGHWVSAAPEAERTLHCRPVPRVPSTASTGTYSCRQNYSYPS